LIFLVNLKYGRLTVVSEVKVNVGKRNRMFFECVCDCGNKVRIRKDCVQSGGSLSCGCLKKEQDKKNLGNHSHKKSHTRLYKIWLGMKARCNNPNVDSYTRYGGRGIKVLGDWNDDFNSFEKWALENGYEEHLTIDRIDNEKGYCPENCRWLTNKEQCNNRRNTNKINFKGEEKSLMQIHEMTGVSYDILKRRYKRGIRDESIVD